MPTKIRLELKCKENDDGTFDAHASDDGAEITGSEFRVLNGTCKDIQELHRKLQKHYPNVKIDVLGPCESCL